MNAIPPRDEALAHGVVPIPPDRLAESYKRIQESHAEDRMRERRRERGRAGLIGALIVSNLALAGALVTAMPLKSVVPVFVTLQADGTFTTTIDQRDVPQDLRENVMAATLWRYTTAREGYTWGGHEGDQGVVYILSDKATGDAYEAEVSPRNANSPWRRYGNRTTVRIERVSEALTCARGPCAGRDPDTYQVRFRRIIRTEGQPVQQVQGLATMSFRLADRVPRWQVTTHNPIGLQVVSYSVTEEGVGR